MDQTRQLDFPRLSLLCACLAMPACDANLLGGDSAESAGTGKGATTDADEQSINGNGSAGASPPLDCSGPAHFGPQLLRRLTNDEYGATIQALITEIPDIVNSLPPDARVGGFDNNAEAAVVTVPHVERYLAGAAQIAAFALSDPTLRARLFPGCEPSETACLTTFISEFGKRAFRRPLTDSEKAQLLALADEALDDPDPTMRAQLALQGLLLSPEFLYRREYGEPDAAQPGRNQLDSYEVAAKLSYMLWGTAPDDALLAAAEASQLSTKEGVEIQARRLLADARAKYGISRFVHQWLRLYRMDDIRRATSQYAEWGEPLHDSLKMEAELLVADHIVPGSDFSGLLTAPYTYLNNLTAPLYGLTGTPDWSRHDFTAADERAGLLTQPGLLMMTAREPVVTPILRGVFVRDVFLCDEPPPPPSGIPEISPPIPGQTVRERLQEHRGSPACSGCHEMMDPIGFGFERYDLMGRLVEVDEFGIPLTGEGEIVGSEDAAFIGAPELGERLAQDEKFLSCVTTHLVRFAQGREDLHSDKCDVQELTGSFEASGNDINELIVALATHDSFRFVGEEK